MQKDKIDSTDDFSVINEKLKKLLPNGTHGNIDEILTKMEESYSLLGSAGDLVVKTPLSALILRLESNDLNPIT